MWSVLEKLLNKPFEVLTLVGGLLVAVLATVSLKKDSLDLNQSPNYVLFAFGVGLAVVSVVVLSSERWTTAGFGGKREQASTLTLVSEADGAFWTKLGECEVRVVYGKIEHFRAEEGLAVVLPCNEYFDDDCVLDVRSALGAYVGAVFSGRTSTLQSLIRDEAVRILGPGSLQKKNDKEQALSFGIGKCFLLENPLGHNGTMALVSTTTQREDEGLAGKISYVFAAMNSVVRALANAGRYSVIVTPVLGSGHGRINAATAPRGYASSNWRSSRKPGRKAN